MRASTRWRRGNPGGGSGTQTHTGDVTAAPTITVRAVTADNIVNAGEAGGTLAVSGTVGGESDVGDTVTLTVDGANYTGTVKGAGVFWINVPGAKLAADATIDASVATTDAAGNVGGGSESAHGDTVDVTAPAPTITSERDHGGQHT